MKKSVNKLTIILIAVIVVLVAVLVYGVCTGFRVKAMLSSMQTQIQQLIFERDDLRNQTISLNDKYNLLEQDVAKIYKGCIKDNNCKGHFPSVSWYCNNVGDETNSLSASHICVCDSQCNLNLTPITR